MPASIRAFPSTSRSATPTSAELRAAFLDDAEQRSGVRGTPLRCECSDLTLLARALRGRSTRSTRRDLQRVLRSRDERPATTNRLSVLARGAMPTYPVRPSGAWVMMVENDVALGAFVTEFLQEAGYGMCVVATGAQAETVFAARRPALILLDMRTSFQDWCEIVAHCVQHDCVQTPVVPMACGSGLLARYTVPEPVTLAVQPFVLVSGCARDRRMCHSATRAMRSHSCSLSEAIGGLETIHRIAT